jgi:hypothetical protein
MSDTIDPLVLLKEALSTQLPISLNDQTKELSIGHDLSLPLELPTAFKRKDEQGFYTLGQLWFWLINQQKGLKPTEYMKSAQAAGIQIV